MDRLPRARRPAAASTLCWGAEQFQKFSAFRRKNFLSPEDVELLRIKGLIELNLVPAPTDTDRFFFSEISVSEGQNVDLFYNSNGFEYLYIVSGEFYINGDLFPANSIRGVSEGEIIDIRCVESGDIKSLCYRMDRDLIHIKYQPLNKDVSFKKSPTVSIIITARNIDRYVCKSILSCISQSYSNIEIILVNDASDDDTLSKLKWAASLDSRVKVIDLTKSYGVNCARKRGLEVSRGHYIFMMDGDDWIASDAVEKLVISAKKDDVDFLYFGFDHFNDLSQTFENAWIPESSSAIRADDLNKNSHYNELSNINNTVWAFFFKSFLRDVVLSSLIEVPLYEDVPFYFAILSKAKSWSSIGSVLYHYRRNREGQATDNWSVISPAKKRAFLKIAMERITPSLTVSPMYARLALLRKLKNITSYEIATCEKNNDLDNAQIWRELEGRLYRTVNGTLS